jgi:hypothetical protein
LPKLLEWWDNSGQRLLLLTGGPGAGKSMVLAWLANHGPPPGDPTAHAQLARVRTLVKAAHFCQATSRNFTPQAFAESIANQLTGAVTGFGDALAATLADRVNIIGTAQAATAAAGASLTGVAIGHIDLSALGDEPSFDRAFVRPLKKLYESGRCEPMLLLVDALDEAQTYAGGKTLPALLSSTLDGLPAGVRVLAATRDDPDMLQFFRGAPRFDLIRDAPPGVDDVRDYAVQRLRKLVTVSDSKRNEFADRLAKQAQGIFLYAALVLDDLIDRPASDLPDLGTYGLPEGLSGIYHDFLKRELGEVRLTWSDRYRPLLGLVAVAQGEGLSSRQLASILNRDLDEVNDTLRRCKQYLSGELPKGPFRSFHKSFADFLLEDKDNDDFHIDATSMHQRIADHYWNICGKSWQNINLITVDDYGIRYLTTHLELAGRIEDLHRLLISERRCNGRTENVWYVEKEALGDISGYQRDVDRAWRLADNAMPTPDQLRLQCRYALITASLASRAAYIPCKLLVGLVQHGDLPWRQALFYARRFSKFTDVVLSLSEYIPLDERTSVFREILSHWDSKEFWFTEEFVSQLPSDLLIEALTLTPYYLVDQFAAIAARLPTEQLDEALAIARKRQEVRTRSVVAIATRLSSERSHRELLTELDDIRSNSTGEEAGQRLAHLAPYLPPAAVGQALDVASRLEDPRLIRRVIRALGPSLVGPNLDRALILAVEPWRLAAGWAEDQVLNETIAWLIPHLPDEEWAKLFAALESAALEYSESWTVIVKIICNLVTYLPSHWHQVAFDKFALRVENPHVDQISLALLPYLGEDAWKHTWQFVGALKDYRVRARTTAALSGLRPDEGAQMAVKIVAAIDPERPLDTQVMEWLLPILPEAVREWARRALLALATGRKARLCRGATRRRQTRQSERNDARSASTLLRLLPYIPADAVEHTYRLALTLQSGYWQARVLAALARRLPKSLTLEAAAEAMQLPRRSDRERALSWVAVRLALLGHLSEALEVTERVKPGRSRDMARALVVKHLQADGKSEQALSVARKIDSGTTRATMLMRLAPDLQPSVQGQLFREALAATWAIRDKEEQDTAKRKLALFLPDEPHSSFGEEVITELANLRRQLLADANPRRQRRLWNDLPLLAANETEDGQRRMLGAVMLVDAPRLQVKLLSRIAPHLRETVAAEAVQEVAQNPDIQRRAMMLARIVPSLSAAAVAETVRRTLTAVKEISNLRLRVDLIRRLAPYLTEEQAGEIEHLASETSDHMHRADVLAHLYRASVLAALAAVPRLARQGGCLKDAIAEARRIPWERARARVLARLARSPGVPLTLLRELLQEAKSIHNQKQRDYTMAAVLPRLAAAGASAQALKSVQKLKNERLLAKALGQIAAYVPKTKLTSALTMARTIRDEGAKVEALSLLLPRLSAGLTNQMVYDMNTPRDPLIRARFLAKAACRLSALGCDREALELVQALQYKDAETRGIWHLTFITSEALARLSRLYARRGNLSESLNLACQILDPFWRTQALAGVASYLGKTDPPDLLATWSATIHAIASRRRSVLLVDLAVLAPMAAAVWGADARAQIVGAIDEVRRQWP